MQPAFVPFGATTAFQGTALQRTSFLAQGVDIPAFHAAVPSSSTHSNGHVIRAITAKPNTDAPKKLSKVEGLKSASKGLRYPLVDELKNDEIFISENAVQIMKFHGSYQQDDREARKPGVQKKYQFMLRLKMPAGDFPSSMYQVLDDISTEFGNNTLRATTRCAWQIHGILKGDLKSVFSRIMNAGGSCVGACGDLSRNVMCTPAPFTNPLYSHARWVSRMLGELFAPQTGAFSEIWLDGEKAGSLEFWKNDLDMNKLQEIMRFDNGNGVVFKDSEEPIYGQVFLPRKFKIGVTVPGDNSIDIYTQDIGVVCIPDATGRTIGYNIIVGGGMGRTHRRETTFARIGDHLGYVSADKIWEALKAIVATQRDHGNRSVRANARMKYLVDKLGIDAFRRLVETYFGEPFEPYRELKPWKYEDWLGWHEQGDGNLFLGLFIENGRIKDEGDFKLRTALRRIIDAYEFDMVVTPNQNIILKNIAPNQKDGIEAILKEHSVKLATEYDMNHRLSMACPAMPLCGLAVTEAERFMPSVVERMNKLFDEYGVKVPITMRMTGCPNGCARPYMGELGFVGSGNRFYQLWLGGCPDQTRLAWAYKERVKEDQFEAVLAPILKMFAEKARPGEAFGDFCDRMGKAELDSYVENLEAEPMEISEVASPKSESSTAKVQTPQVTVEDAHATPINKVNNTRVTVLDEKPSTSDEKKTVITVVNGPPKITILGATELKVDEVPAKQEPIMTVTGDKNTPSSNQSEKSAQSTEELKSKNRARKASSKPKPRLTVSDEIMDRLKNIAALRDMSASNVADEILSTYLSGVEDEDLIDGN